MINIPLIIIISIIFGLMILSYSINDKDYAAISLLGCFLAATLTGMTYGLELPAFIDFISFEAIIVILSFRIITSIAQESNILEFLAVKLFRISKGRKRVFFYLICIITTLFSAFISGIIIILILAPIVIRLCHFLKIKPGTFLIGMTLSVNVGSILTPWKNIIISAHFNLDAFFYIQHLWLFSFILLLSLLLIIDLFWLSKEPEIEPEQKKLVLDLVDASVIIENKKKFYINGIGLTVSFILLFVLPYVYLTSAFSAFIMVLINRKLRKKKITDILKEFEWEFIFFLIASFIIVGCLLEAGLKEILNLIPFESMSTLLILLFIMIAVVAVMSFLPDTPTALLFIPIIEILIIENDAITIPLLFTFLIAFNIGGNLLPQGSSCDMLTLEIADDHKLNDVSFTRLLKMGGLITIIHLVMTFVYFSILLVFFN